MNPKMEWSVLVAMAFLLLAVAVYANPRVDANQMVEKMRSDLDLTQEQVEAIRPVIEDHLNKKEELYTQIRELEESKKEKLSSILDPEQMDKYQQKKWKGKAYIEKSGEGT